MILTFINSLNILLIINSALNLPFLFIIPQIILIFDSNIISSFEDHLRLNKIKNIAFVLKFIVFTSTISHLKFIILIFNEQLKLL
jgi:hypothetical protein